MKDILSDIYNTVLDKSMIDDDIIKKYLKMKEQIKKLEKECDFLTDTIKNIGAFETVQFRIDITKYTQERLAPLNLVVDRFGREALGDLIKTIECSRIKIEEKTKIERSLK